jgi:hypothetical protein
MNQKMNTRLNKEIRKKPENNFNNRVKIIILSDSTIKKMFSTLMRRIYWNPKTRL